MPSSRSARTSSQAERRAAGSKPVVGSSRNNELGVADEGDAEVEAALLAPRERLDPRVALLREPDELDHLVDVARARVVPGEHPVHLAHREHGGQLGVLQDDPDLLAKRRAAAPGIEAEHLTSPASRGAVALEDLHRRRLAGAVRPEQAEDLAPLDLEVDPLDRLDVAVGLAQARDAERASSRDSELSSTRIPATGNPGSWPVSASTISEQSGWWPTVATGPRAPRRAPRRSQASRRARARVDPNAARRALAELRSRLARADERARRRTTGGGLAAREEHCRAPGPARAHGP